MTGTGFSAHIETPLVSGASAVESTGFSHQVQTLKNQRALAPEGALPKNSQFCRLFWASPRLFGQARGFLGKKLNFWASSKILFVITDE